MEFGICVPHYGKPINVSQILGVVRRAEELGFDSVWVTDHILVPQTLDIIYRDNMLEPLALLSHIAAVVSRVQLGTSVIILPYRNPIVVAKMLATVDQLSGGRLIVGVGGGWMEQEFAALGVSFAERGLFSDESLRLFRELWTRERVSVQGQYFSFEDMQVSPPPVQQPCPSIWIGGMSARARRRVAEFGDGWHATALPAQELSQAYSHLQKLWQQKGRAGEPLLSMRARLFIEGVSEDVLSYPPRPGWDVLQGSSQAIVERIGEYQKVGVRHLVFELSTQSFDSSLRTMETFVNNIKPQLV
jgi:probable F420-dependent oxidoreductase